jgi:mannose-6-phosphate isomerase
MTKLGPCRTAPRLDAKPWGGRRLAEFGIALPAGERIGEAVLTAQDAVLATGPFAGQTLGDVVVRDPETLLGVDGLTATSGRALFPLLIKLIDAERALSIQVHPNDALAPAGSLGKTEAWHVLGARTGAVIYVGLREGVGLAEVAAAARAGRPLVDLVRALPAAGGMTLLAPAGTIHALGAGLVVYEIQQPSAVTYRLDDWRRPDDPAPPRELHIEAGLAALDSGSRPAPIPVPPSGLIQRLTECSYFALDRIELSDGKSLTLPARDGPQTFTCLRGEANLRGDGGAILLRAGETAVLFAGEGELDLSTELDNETALLVGTVPASAS